MTIEDPIVLIVDDSENDMLLMRTVFGRAGFVQPLRFARDGEHAIEHAGADVSTGQQGGERALRVLDALCRPETGTPLPIPLPISWGEGKGAKPVAPVRGGRAPFAQRKGFEDPGMDKMASHRGQAPLLPRAAAQPRGAVPQPGDFLRGR